ncbi:hypothetical protein SAMN04487965_2358 [Microbulbifer donghaiensis]|uniref:SpoIIAA-like n=1 Tax=Microbulbifer donghaiensis TaxID=494016 RepID=A0A1M5CZ76_9GAMM|nr:hypothetical protein [Microbulbifer donghaiensis]SHF60133.1 hypothetical protein SAMN04487965_2358 [Microbulbifer donghaiensis]
MNFHITYRPEVGIARILFYGTVGLAERMEAVGIVAEKFQHRTPLRLLVDLRYARSVIAPEEQRRLGRFLAEHPVLGRAHIAVLYSRNRYSSLMVASEAKSRGHSSREFDIEAEAEAWLLQTKDESPSLASRLSVTA